MFVESGGDNLTAIFRPALADVQIFVIDVAGGDDIPRKGGPGIARSDLLAINKTDLAPYVGADLDRMLRDSEDRRGGLPFLFLSLIDDPPAHPSRLGLRTGRPVPGPACSAPSRGRSITAIHHHTHSHDLEPLAASSAGRNGEERAS